MIEFGHLSHVGLRRDLNEDTYYGDSELGLWLVADGMGGHEYGEVASALAREAIVREVRAGRPLADAIRIADEEIIRCSKRRGDSLPMGTTVAAARVDGNRFEVAWVGDSRVYLWRDATLTQISQDHSYVQELIAQGAITPDQARSHPRATRASSALAQRHGHRVSSCIDQNSEVRKRTRLGAGCAPFLIVSTWASSDSSFRRASASSSGTVSTSTRTSAGMLPPSCSTSWFKNISPKLRNELYPGVRAQPSIANLKPAVSPVRRRTARCSSASGTRFARACSCARRSDTNASSFLT